MMAVAFNDLEIRTLVLAVAYLQANFPDIEYMHEECPFSDFTVQETVLPLPSEEMMENIIKKLRGTYV